MALPGTQLANQVLGETGLKRKLSRQYTYKRANDRSYKLWGSFTEADGERLRRALAEAGALDARIVYGFVGFSGRGRHVSGVRFEMPGGQ